MLYCTASSWFVKTKEGANHFVPEVIQKHFDTEVNTRHLMTLWASNIRAKPFLWFSFMSHFAAHLCICPYLKLLSGFCEGVGWLLYVGALHLNDKTFVNSLWQNKPDCSLYKDERKTRRVSFLLRYLWYFHLFYCFVSFFPVMLQNKCF